MPDLPDIPKAEVAIIAQTNVFRRAQKLADLKPNAELTRAARLFAQYLAKTGKFAHEADGRQPWDRTKAAGYKHCSVAENLSMNLDSRGFTSAKLATEAMEGWKASPGHRANLVRREVTEIGVGIARAPTADPKYIAVQLFGRPESLKYAFQIENRSGETVTYKALGRSKTIPARSLVTLTVCEEGDVVFERAGGWFSNPGVIGQFKAKAGAIYRITDAPGGVRVTVHDK